MERALKGVELQASAPELDERKARAGEEHGLEFVRRGKTLDALEKLIRSQEHVIELHRGCNGIPVHPEGSSQQRDRDCAVRYGCNTLARQDELGAAVLRSGARHDCVWWTRNGSSQE
jgi:hypothetical protein